MAGNSFLGGNTIVNINNTPEIKEYTTGENVGSERAVMIENGVVMLFDPTDQSNYNKYIGITANSALNGEQIQVILFASVTVSFAVTVGANYYASESGNGVPVTTLPTTGIYQEIAIGAGTNELFIVKGQPIKI